MKKISLFIFYTLLIVAVITAYKNPVREQPLVSIARNNVDRTPIAVVPKDTIITGADQTEKYVPYLKGKRVAILVNQTSILGRRHMAESLQSLGVNIVKVFGPEHVIAGVSEEEIRKSWEPGLSNYKKMRKKYLIYGD